MFTIVRVLVTAIIFAATYLFVYWVPFSLIDDRPEFLAVVGALASALLAAGAVWRATHAVDQGLIGTALYWAAVVGGIGFVGGFFGPIILTPDANQGPLLGLFITGPLGFLAGGIGGAMAWLIRGPRGGAAGTR